MTSKESHVNRDSSLSRAVAPTPAGQAMAGPVFSLHLAGLTCTF